MESLFKLKRKASKETGFKSLYLDTPKKWTSKGRLLTKAQLEAFIRSYWYALPVGDKFPSDWEIVTYAVSENNTRSFEERLHTILTRPLV